MQVEGAGEAGVYMQRTQAAAYQRPASRQTPQQLSSGGWLGLVPTLGTLQQQEQQQLQQQQGMAYSSQPQHCSACQCRSSSTSSYWRHCQHLGRAPCPMPGASTGAAVEVVEQQLAWRDACSSCCSSRRAVSSSRGREEAPRHPGLVTHLRQVPLVSTVVNAR